MALSRPFKENRLAQPMGVLTVSVDVHLLDARSVLCAGRSLLGGSVKLVCTSECPLQSFAREVARGRSVTSGPISE